MSSSKDSTHPVPGRRPGPVAVAALIALLAAGGSVPAGRALAAAAPSASPATPIPPELVPWDQEGDFAALMARAKKEKKPVFLDFYAIWCGPCKMMDRQTYSDSTVAAAAAKYVNRKVDAERGEGVVLARRYGITAYPTVVLLDASGKEINRQAGFQPPERFARFLDDTREGRGTIDGIEKLIAAGQDTPVNRVALGEKYAQRGDVAAAREQFDRALALAPDDPDGRIAGLLLLVAGTRRSTGAHAAAVEDYERFLALFPKSPRLVEAQTGMAVSLAESGRPEEGFAIYKKYADTRPDDAQVQGSVARFAAALKVQLDAGLAAGQRAVELSEGDPTAYDALAEIRSARGEWDEAVVAAERALEKRPNDNYLRGRLEKFQEGAAAAVQDRKRGGD